jgi:hypothetical protein
MKGFFVCINVFCNATLILLLIPDRLLIEERNSNASQVKLYPNATNGVLIVKITTQDNHIITKKEVQ